MDGTPLSSETVIDHFHFYAEFGQCLLVELNVQVFCQLALVSAYSEFTIWKVVELQNQSPGDFLKTTLSEKCL